MVSQAERENIEAFVRTMYDREIRTQRSLLDEQQRTIVGYTDSVTTAMRRLREIQRQLDATLKLIEEDATDGTILREWDLLAAHPRVEELVFRDGAVRIKTTPDLRLHHPLTGETRWLGRFQVSMGLAGNVTLRNLSTPRGGRDHPHIVDQRPCFGGHDLSFSELLAKGELFTLFELILQYLETLNVEDEYGRYGSYWFDVPDMEPIDENAVDDRPAIGQDWTGQDVHEGDLIEYHGSSYVVSGPATRLDDDSCGIISDEHGGSRRTADGRTVFGLGSDFALAHLVQSQPTLEGETRLVLGTDMNGVDLRIGDDVVLHRGYIEPVRGTLARTVDGDVGLVDHDNVCEGSGEMTDGANVYVTSEFLLMSRIGVTA